MATGMGEFGVALIVAAVTLVLALTGLAGELAGVLMRAAGLVG
jgi:hypothetical protein